mgnify:CR=1 FL=1
MLRSLRVSRIAVLVMRHPEAVAEIEAEDDDAAQARRQDTLLRLDAELRAAAQLIMQDVINDYTPHIETEIKRLLKL